MPPEPSPPLLTATQTKLVLAALGLFAKHGIASVTIRQIVRAAEQSNESAVHYHFGGKDELLAAIFDYIDSQLAPLQAKSLAELDTIALERLPTVKETVTQGIMPFVTFYAQSPIGPRSLRFLSRLLWQAQDQEMMLLVAKLWPYYARIEHFLVQALPDKPQDALRLHCILAAFNLLHNLADTRLLRSQSSLGISHLLNDRPDLLIEYFIDYVVGGITAPASAC
jgi:AcrR family transcriptional regulator